MFTNYPKQHLVPNNGSFVVSQAKTLPDNIVDEKAAKKQLKNTGKVLYELQRKLYAHDQYSILLIFQAMDAAGKDSTIRHVLRPINPAGCQVSSFKQPSKEELDHDFLWRTSKRLPQRGRIGVFNRSYYEEVLILKVHPEYLKASKLPEKVNQKTLWKNRYESIRQHEEHLANNGYIILKFWLNISKEEQKNRFLMRLDNPEKNWKFSASDIAERQHWDQYMNAYQQALNETSRPWAPWYAIPADNKPYARAIVAETIATTMQTLNLSYPALPEKNKANFSKARTELLSE